MGNDSEWYFTGAKLFPNVKGCGYPPMLNCSIFYRQYANIGQNFSCYYSKVDPGIVISDLDMWQSSSLTEIGICFNWDLKTRSCELRVIDGDCSEPLPGAKEKERRRRETTVRVREKLPVVKKDEIEKWRECNCMMESAVAICLGGGTKTKNVSSDDITRRFSSRCSYLWVST
ncbi:hypothetical protein K0M31_012282 [Melipona bicolor]|uniref:Uncharacterized protein n=1 Tax=Melipona bicolor TaxID=60889 RepID=A0AA40FKM4_9HYME|nr:hypothetical protein K0M31_012282 [Melipona bicolor]